MGDAAPELFLDSKCLKTCSHPIDRKDKKGKKNWKWKNEELYKLFIDKKRRKTDSG